MEFIHTIPEPKPFFFYVKIENEDITKQTALKIVTLISLSVSLLFIIRSLSRVKTGNTIDERKKAYSTLYEL